MVSDVLRGLVQGIMLTVFLVAAIVLALLLFAGQAPWVLVAAGIGIFVGLALVNNVLATLIPRWPKVNPLEFFSIWW